MSKFDGGYVNIHTNTANIQNMAMMRASISQIIVFLLKPNFNNALQHVTHVAEAVERG